MEFDKNVKEFANYLLSLENRIQATPQYNFSHLHLSQKNDLTHLTQKQNNIESSKVTKVPNKNSIILKLIILLVALLILLSAIAIPLGVVFSSKLYKLL
jgi:hypothetical protein